MTYQSEALDASQSRKSQRASTWRDTVGLCCTIGQGTTPAAATQSTFFVFLLVRCLPSLGRAIFSVNSLVFRSRLPPYRRILATILPASFASKLDSYPASGMEGLRRNLADIGSTPPPPAAGYSLGRASAMEQGMGEGILLTSDGQASNE